MAERRDTYAPCTIGLDYFFFDFPEWLAAKIAEPHSCNKPSDNLNQQPMKPGPVEIKYYYKKISYKLLTISNYDTVIGGQHID